MRSSLPRCLFTIVAASATAFVGQARATPALVMDVATGDVLYDNQATQPWYPASLTKLMTVYVALNAVREHRIAFDTPLVVSARAAAMPPSHMAFPPGTEVTLDNALKMLMVKSANDLAITIAEGVSGSVEAFADDMNETAATLGLRESHFVNPNGLPAAGHVSSARDMAIIARALYRDFPDQAGLFNIGAFALGGAVTPNHNNLLGRYPGVDGMKTGFTCAAGFNVVASAYRDGRRLVTVVMGAPNVAARSAKAAALFDRGFAGVDRAKASVLSLPASAVTAPSDMRNEVCRNRGRLIAAFNNEVEQLDAPLLTAAPAASPLFGAAAARPTLMATVINSIHPAPATPVPVYVGAEAGYTGPVAQARPPHSPIGTQPDPAAAIAYAAPPAAAGNPLGVDPTALPMRGRRRIAHAVHAPKPRASKTPANKTLADKTPADKTPADTASSDDEAKPASVRPEAAKREAAAPGGESAKGRKKSAGRLKSAAGDGAPKGKGEATPPRRPAKSNGVAEKPTPDKG